MNFEGRIVSFFLKDKLVVESPFFLRYLNLALATPNLRQLSIHLNGAFEQVANIKIRVE